MKRLSITVLSFALMFAFMLSHTLGKCHAADSNNLEYKLKAAFIYNFIKFTKWPKTTKCNSKDNPLVLCVAGTNPFGNALDPLAHKKVADRQIVLVHAPIVDDLQHLCNCHVVFVAATPSSALFIQALEQQQVLTISDEAGFCKHGGCIELREQNGKIRFIINRLALKQQGLELGYQVYDLALEVIDEQDD